MKKIRVESFAKTPYFLKSPGSMASSRVNQDQEYEYTSLRTYKEELIDLDNKKKLQK